LGNLNAVRQARAVEIPFAHAHNLRFCLKPPEGSRVDYAALIPLVFVPFVILARRLKSPKALAKLGIINCHDGAPIT
jgi:hypothetical protein